MNRASTPALDAREIEGHRAALFGLCYRMLGSGADAEDARQETLITLTRHVGRMRAEGPLQAAKWISTIYRRKRIDRMRARQVDPVTRGLATARRTDDRPGPLDRLESIDEPSLADDALDRVIETVLGHVHAALEDTVPNTRKRALRRVQAHAALLRLVCEWDSAAIVSALDYGDPIGNDRLYKWIERGRAPLLLGLERWMESTPEDQREDVGRAVEALREAVHARRADAGKPRPERRRSPGDDS